MIIHDSFYLNGFTRIDKGEEGAVFLRYGAPKANDKTALDCISWHGKGATYAISIPQRSIEACVLMTRSSKNCYQATIFDERRIASLRADTLDGMRNAVVEFLDLPSATK